MYSYSMDADTGGIILGNDISQHSKEARPVYSRELDILGFDRYFRYAADDEHPYMWAEANNYFYRGRLVARTRGGQLYTKPEIEVLEQPEADNAPLKPVDIDGMVEKNREIIETLVQQTIKRIYSVYTQYKDRTDTFYVAFSGGKDSVVILDLVKRVLPTDAYIVVFGNTDMEFPTTYQLTSVVKGECTRDGIRFYEASCDMPASQTWELFGPPARKVRWCCSVHKTVPVINKLCDILQLDKIRTVMITGVRASESFARSSYEDFSIGKKLAGQYSFHPILEWSSPEVFLYMYMHGLLFNEAYKYGFSRVGCIMCPNSSEKHEYIKHQCFPLIVDEYCDRIARATKKDLSGDNRRLYLENGIWKARATGRELAFSEPERFEYEETKKYHLFRLKSRNDNWIIWYRTIGQMIDEYPNYALEYNGTWRNAILEYSTNGQVVIKIENDGRTKNSIEFLSLFKSILAKTYYCIECRTCEAECPLRCISMSNGTVSISERCVRCHACLKILSGCLYYNSIRGSNTVKETKGFNKYLSVGVDAEWIKYYFEDQTYEPGNRKSDVMFGFLRDAGITKGTGKNKRFTSFGNVIAGMDLEAEIPWALMLCNLVYTPAFGWYCRNIPFDEDYIRDRLYADIDNGATRKAQDEFWNGFKVILYTNKSFRGIGFGIPTVKETIHEINGTVSISMNAIRREEWAKADPRVILYSLYLLAEKCGAYHRFTLTWLMNKEVERDGISPAQIFGLSYDTMKSLLIVMAANYPDYITVSFTHDLDNINLNSAMTSADVLKLF